MSFTNNRRRVGGRVRVSKLCRLVPSSKTRVFRIPTLVVFKFTEAARIILVEARDSEFLSYHHNSGIWMINRYSCIRVDGRGIFRTAHTCFRDVMLIDHSMQVLS